MTSRQQSAQYANYGVVARRLSKGEMFLAEVQGGFVRRPVDEDGVVVSDRAGREMFVPLRVWSVSPTRGRSAQKP